MKRSGFGFSVFVFISIFFLLSATVFLLPGCGGGNSGGGGGGDDHVDYRQEMREFVQNIGSYARHRDADFILIPQNGHNLLTDSGDIDGKPEEEYISSINGVGREDLFYGYEEDNEETPEEDQEEMLPFMDLAEEQGLQVLAINYCYDEDKMDDAYNRCDERGYISFSADHRELDNIPSYPANPFNENAHDIEDLNSAQNFLYIINPQNYSTVGDFINDLQATNYDVLVIDAFFNDTLLTRSQVESLKTKNNGGKRLVIAYMSIGEAEDYRYYWDSSWETDPPSWLLSENPDWPGNYKVKYWDSHWQDIIYGNTDSYTYKLLSSGFDGAYLDLIDAYEYFEE